MSRTGEDTVTLGKDQAVTNRCFVFSSVKAFLSFPFSLFKSLKCYLFLLPSKAVHSNPRASSSSLQSVYPPQRASPNAPQALRELQLDEHRFDCTRRATLSLSTDRKSEEGDSPEEIISLFENPGKSIRQLYTIVPRLLNQLIRSHSRSFIGEATFRTGESFGVLEERVRTREES